MSKTEKELSIEEEIARQEAAVAKSKARYDADVKKLNALLDRQDEIRRNTQMDAVEKRGTSAMKEYTFKVYPKGKGRECYRVIHISGKETLDRLCEVILDAFDFMHEHLYEFCMNNRMYEEDNYQSYPDLDMEYQKSTTEKIDRLQLVKGQKFSLHYDFGDDWMFVISVQGIDETAEPIAPYITRERGFITQYPDYEEFE
ncbi:MAG: plasmid pRiA4b ORF-3 family protein [Clostridiales bacterium]|nr:plasmid pRiA4b ORF-3 family protein [Clostridiales bacterium]